MASFVDNWSQLSHDVLVLIFNKLSIRDYIRSSAVCAQWNIIFKSERSSRLVPFMVVQNNKKESAKFFAFRDGKFHIMRVPNVNTLYPKSNGCLRFCFGASNEWLITVDENYVVRLDQPLAGREIPLPRLRDFPRANWGMEKYFRKAALLPSESPTVMVIHDSHKVSVSLVNLGDTEWRMMRIGHGFQPIDVIVHGGKFHTLSLWGMVLVWEPEGLSFKPRCIAPNLPQRDELVKVAAFLKDNPKFCDRRTREYKFCLENCFARYLVEFVDGENLMLVLVIENNMLRKPYQISIRVLLLDKEKFKWIHIRSLVKQVLFLGNNYSICHRASMFPDLQPNCIYFVNDFFGGVYHLKDNIVEPMDIPKSGSSNVSSNIWFMQKL